MTQDMRRVGVVGLGTMGAGIVEVVARRGLDVVGVDLDAAGLARGQSLLEASTARAVERDKMTADEREALLGRVTLGSDIAALADCDIVIEAVPEKLDVKRAVFALLDGVVSASAILATNTSSLSVTDIAAATAHPKRVVGMHFFNPAPVRDFVEIIGTVITEPQALADVKALAEQLGKQPVVVGDKAGFIANALLLGYLNHAVTMLENRYASREDIDAAMRFGCGLPMGPLAVVDLIGLDTVYSVLDTMYKEGRDRLHAPAPLLKHMVAAGLLGRKSGRGFYTYAKPGSGTVVPDAAGASAAGDGTPTRPIGKVGVVGSGTMASGIVEVFAKAGYDVRLLARSEDKAQGALAAVGKSLNRAVDKGKMTAEARDAVLAHVLPSADMNDLADVDLVVEAVAEDLAIKQGIFGQLDAICKPGAVLATTTSSLPVIQVANATTRPADVIGMHFFNPAAVMKLVEIVSTVATSADVAATVLAVTKKIGKHPVSCSDRSGFIVNALLFPYLNDAVKMLEAHYATADDIDVAMKLGCGYPMGPFELLDVVGLDVSLAIQRELYLEFRERGFAPAPLLEHLVTAGYLGRKARRGFRSYA